MKYFILVSDDCYSCSNWFQHRLQLHLGLCCNSSKINISLFFL